MWIYIVCLGKQESHMKKILTIVGPTASGKTSFAIELAKKINGEIISLDSRQIYQHMTIGTAQPNKKEMDGVKHHLIGCLHPSKNISSGKYSRMVKKKVSQVENANKTPIICGGSGLYYRAIKKGIFSESATNLEIRKKIESQYLDNPQKLYEKLQSVDSKYSKIVHINNRQRLIRALEIYELTGDTPSEHFRKQKYLNSDNLNLFTVFLKWNRAMINTRIEKRTNFMFELGWIEEAKNLLILQKEKGLKFSPINSIGYEHIQAYLNQKITKDEMIDKIVVGTRQLARRQEKWFKKESIDLYIEMDMITIAESSKILYCILKSLV